MKVAIKSSMGETIATVELEPRTFSTGSKGYYTSQKLQYE